MKKPFYKRKWFIAIVVVLVLAALGNVIGGKEKTEQPNEVVKTDEITAEEKANKEIEDAKKEAEKAKKEAEEAKKEAEKAKQEAAEAKEEAEKANKEIEDAKEEVSDNTAGIDKQTEIDLILEILNENFEATGYYKYDEDLNSFNLYATDEDFKGALVARSEGLLKDEWETMRESFRSMSKSLSDSVASGYLISILNPYNEENIVLSVMDGVVIYDAFTD